MQVLYKTQFLKQQLKQLTACQSQFNSSQNRLPTAYENNACQAAQRNRRVTRSGRTTCSCSGACTTCCLQRATFCASRHGPAACIACRTQHSLQGMQAKKDLETHVRDVLDEINRDPSRKQEVMSNAQIALSEEIEVLRHIQAKMAEFKKKVSEEGLFAAK